MDNQNKSLKAPSSVGCLVVFIILIVCFIVLLSCCSYRPYNPESARDKLLDYQTEKVKNELYKKGSDGLWYHK